MEDEILTGIDRKLDAVVRLLASRFIEGRSKTEAIIALGSLGLDTNLIAEIVVTTPGTVQSRLSEARRKSKAEGKKVTKKVKSK